MVWSHTSGELLLRREVAKVSRVARSSPKASFSISTVSSARSRAVTLPTIGLSERVSALKAMCRCRWGTGTSTGSTIGPPAMCTEAAMWLSFWRLSRSSSVARRRRPSRSRM